MNTRSRVRFASLVVVLISLVFVSGLIGSRGAFALQATPEASPIAGGESVELTGLVNTPGPITVADLQALTAETVDVTFLSGQGEQQHSYTGVRLWDVLDQAGIQLHADIKNDVLRKYVVITANDGYETVISLGEIDPGFGANPYLLAWEEDGAALTGDAGPVRLITPGDVKGGRYVSGVVTIEVRDVDSSTLR